MTPYLFVAFAVFGQSSSLAKGIEALEQSELDRALDHLHRAQQEGPHGFEDHVRLFASLGTAYAYLGRHDDAVKAYERLLAIDPSHAVSYTLSPKATFAFEEARRNVHARPRTTLHVTWPHDRATTAEPIPVDVEVVADHEGLLRSATLHFRLRGAEIFERIDFRLPDIGGAVRVSVPPLAADATATRVAEVHLEAQDEQKNVVYRFGTAAHPRPIQLAYVPPEAWYTKWWVWTAVVGLVAAGTGALVYGLTRQPSPTLTANLHAL